MPVSTSYGVDVTNGLVGGQDIEQSGSIFALEDSSLIDRDEVEVHKHAKKERGQYPAILTEQAWSMKDLLYGIKHHNMINVHCGT